MKTISVFFALLFCFVLFACEVGVIHKKQEVRQTSYKSFYGWKYGNVVLGYKGFMETCNAIDQARWPGNTLFRENKEVWLNKCKTGRNYKTNPQAFFEKYFNPYLVEGENGYQGTFTGYYEIEVKGCLKPTPTCKYPIYGIPRDSSLLNLTRAQIDLQGALKGKNLEIAYTESLGRLYFLHIQGTGRVALPDGKFLHIGFAGTNNYQYKSFAADVIANGKMPRDQLSATKMMDWIDRNGEFARRELTKNQRYIFFEPRDNSPRGSQGVYLTPMGSVAVDREYIPLGTPLWVETVYPKVAYEGLPRNLTFLANAQDTGAAIKGAVRADIFFGAGTFAETVSSGMKQQGKYYILLPKEIRADKYF